MKKITDERLQWKNLQNIRIAYVIQTLGILAILGYDLVTKGMDGMTANPLWFVFLVTVVVSAYLSMHISVQHESEQKEPQKRFVISLSILILVSIAVGMLVTLTTGFDVLDGILFGGIIFICGLVPIIYLNKLRKKNKME